jgi:basic amino acid/polyamine antiporter, APA family
MVDHYEVPTALRRQLGLPLLVLYGTGITIGAGIYVLIGAVAGHAGVYAPWSFLMAAAVMALTVASYAELATRFPVSAAEAAYVKAAFSSRALSTLTGLLTIVVGIVSSATVTLGAAGYIHEFVDLPKPIIAFAVVFVLGAVAAWGILESVLLASVFTLIEVGGLVAIIIAGINAKVPFSTALLSPPSGLTEISGAAFASLLAFFAFIGFEDLANAVEEAKIPHRDIPRAMVATLLISSVLYVLVAAIAVSTVPIGQLSASPAPLSLVFGAVAAVNPSAIGAIAIVATLNTILAQMTMASRVIYGMARQGDLPRVVGHVHLKTRTPLIATALIILSVILLALAFPLEGLAESTSIVTLVVFALVNASLVRLHYRKIRTEAPHVRVPTWVPVVGLITCVLMIAAALLG